MATKINRSQPDVDLSGDTPSKQLTRRANEVYGVHDSLGRSIKLKRPNAISKLRFIEALGESSSNKLWTAAVWPLMFVTEIDGISVPTPIAKQEVEALYTRLGDEGMDAVTTGLSELFSPADEAVDPEAAKK